MKMQHIFLAIALVFSGTLASCQSPQKGSQTQVTYLSVDEFGTKITKTNGVILDVRTADEFSAGHIPNAVNIDFFGSDFESKIQMLDPEKEYYVYCVSGNRSGKAARLMADKGFKKVNSLENAGYADWLKWSNSRK